MKWQSQIKSELLAIPGWRTSRHIVVLESDDWGSLRMSSNEAFEQLTDFGIDLGPKESLRFNRFDCIESLNDLNGLLEILSGHHDSNGRSPVLTMMTLVANPNFEKIEEEKFECYSYEKLPDTLRRFYPNDRVWELWTEGISAGLFAPEFHGREHLNIHHWMKALRSNDKQARFAFGKGFWGYNNGGIAFQAAFDFWSPSELVEHAGIILDGLDVFEGLFGFRAEFFVPPNGLLGEKIYSDLERLGIKFVYSARRNPTPVGLGKRTIRYNFLGKSSPAGQLYITRNAFFEPSMEGKDWVSSCFKDVERAFRWNKPAIISSHRVNFVGSLFEGNRKKGLAHLDRLIKELLYRWPDIEFMTTRELGRLMQCDRD